jgi:hypothetical protein
MNAKNGQTIEWSTRDKLVWGKPRTYNGHKKIYPKFQSGASPWKGGEYYITCYKNEKTYSVHFYIPGYTSLNRGYVPSQTKILLSGESLSNCKKYLADLIKSMYSN